MKYNFVKKIEVLLLILSTILIGASMYFIGNMSAIDSKLSTIQIVYPDSIATKTSVTVQNLENSTTETISSLEVDSVKGAKIVASKNGKRYYYAYCSGVKRIKEENKIYFDTKEQAESQGLTLASGCKAL